MLPEHEKWMKAALSLARRGLGNVAPNPAVGCLLVKDGIVVGLGWTQPGGRPHAETEALKMAGQAARGATAYVTLEPCAHHGKTPPCAEALVHAGVSEVVVAVQDPDERVNSKGIKLLETADIKVTKHILKDEARKLNAGFFSAVQKGRPFFALKSAATIDGKIATENGESKWITGPQARQFGHLLRAKHDAIVVGVNTVIADDPLLDCRLAGLEERSPIPIILDSHLRTPQTCKLLGQDKIHNPLIICGKYNQGNDAAKSLSEAGANLLYVSDTRDMQLVSKAILNQGINRVLVEGGAQVLAAFLTAGMCDELLSFQASKIIGCEGLNAIGSIGLVDLDDAPHLRLETIRKFGSDLLATYVNAE